MTKKKNTFPVVLVGGIFSHGEKERDSMPAYWVNAIDNNVVPLGVATPTPSISPVASHWIRACQLIAQIKGIRVDITEEYARKNGLTRFGEDHSGEGFYPEWSEENPVHFLAYSAGGPTAHYAQYILANDLLGIGSSDKWVKSISSISSSFNGTTWSNILSPFDGIFSIYARVKEVYGKKKEFGGKWELDVYGLSRREGESFFKHFMRVFGDTSFVKKTLANDLKIGPAAELNKKYFKLYPNTYYFSYVSHQKFKHLGNIWVIGAFLGMVLMPINKFIRNLPGGGTLFKRVKYWRKNDGAVPVISQYTAWTHNSNKPKAHRLRKFKDNLSTQIMYYSRVDFDHTDYFNYAEDPRKSRGLFRYIYGILESL